MGVTGLHTRKLTPLKGPGPLYTKGWSNREINVLPTGD